MSAMGRRAILKVLGLSPAAASMLPGMVARQAVSGSALGLMAGYPGSPPCNPANSAQPIRFVSFAKWLANIGEDTLRREAHYVGMIDPDILEMRLPLNTKINWQRERNYARLIDEKRNWFDTRIAKFGVVEWWE